MKTKSLTVAAILIAVSTIHAYAADGNEPERKQLWTELSESIFGDKPIKATDSVIWLEAAERAEDAALVPIKINMAPDAGVVGAVLIIDENPSPVAARIKFGPAADPRQMKLRIRVNSYTNMHVVAETAAGELYQYRRFIKASGGCSAPVGVSDAEAVKTMGQMRMKFGSNAELDGAPEATLMIRHPNFNGMQMDQLKRTYTPARFITSINVRRGDQTVFLLESDITLSTNPVISFLYKPGPNDTPFHLTVKDSDGGSWERDFDVPEATN